ncbi:TraI domain-containing protein (plasmid) [Vibrio campbellii]|uniref:MobH family relaxase n=1 Tax=Vibrio campbellii TaxID=680 RepID=UPI001F07B514|nr:MobH family relaxase [Vibrio campbellii]UMM06588.1 TraI domain-containing protein [Vibrio campbellii]
MFSQLKGALHKVLCGAANVVAPNSQTKVATPVNDLTIEDLIRYPPETKGIPVIALEKIVASQVEILRLMHRDSGLPDPYEQNQEEALKPRAVNKAVAKKKPELNFDTLFRQVVVNYIKYVHLLPASENHHHCDVGGLARHSLEVALNSLRKAQHQVLPAIGHLDEEQARKPRWQYAAWVCGLLHDAGKVLYDMRVYDVDTGNDWNPYLSDLITWAQENGVSRYRVVWRPEHRHKKHENLSVTVLEWVLTPEAKAYLMDNTDELPIAINHALAHYGSSDGYLQGCLREADSASTEKDIQTQWHEMIGKRRYPLESALVNAMRRLRDNWQVNQPKGHVWIIGQDVYLSWPKTIQLIVQRLQEDKVDVPVNPSRILEILEERNLVRRLDDSVTYSMFTPSGIEGVTGAERVICLAWPGLLYETMPVPRSVPGVLRLNNDGKSLEYKADGSVLEIEPDCTGEKKTEEGSSNSGRQATTEFKQLGEAKAEIGDQNGAKAKQKPKSQSKSKPQQKPKVKSASKKQVKDGKREEQEIAMPVIPKASERPVPKANSKGLIFANQGEQKTVITSKPEINAGPIDSQHVRPELGTPEADADDLQVPEYLTMDDSNFIEPDCESELQEPSFLSAPDYVEKSDKPQSEAPIHANESLAQETPVESDEVKKDTTLTASPQRNQSKRQTASSGGVGIGNMLRQKKASMRSPVNLEPKGWLGQKKSGRSKGDVFLIDLAKAMANGELGIEKGKGVFLVAGQLYLDSKAVCGLLGCDAGETATSLKNDRLLDYDKLKPNLLVQRKNFGGKQVMAMCLTKKVSSQLCAELGITATDVNYEPEKAEPKEGRAFTPEHRSGVSKPDSVPEPTKEESNKTDSQSVPGNSSEDDVAMFIAFLSKKALSGECDFIQKAPDGKTWGVFVQGAIKAFMEEERKGANRNQLSKELTMLAVGVEEMTTPLGKKKTKHLLIQQAVIG